MKRILTFAAFVLLIAGCSSSSTTTPPALQSIYSGSVGSNAKPLTKQERWALREIMTEPKYNTWYSTEVLGPQQRKLNHPNAIINAYKRKHPDANKQPRPPRQPSPALSPALSAKNKEIEQLRALRPD